MKLPTLKALTAFHAVAKFGSIRRAAEELGVDHSLVSRHLQALQRETGTALVITSRKGVVLTEAGTEYHRTVRDALAAISGATARLRSAQFAKRLVVASIPGFALNWLTPRLADFHKRFPEIDLTLKPMQIPADLDAGEADIVIHYGEVASPTTRSQALARPRVFPVVSPDWMARLPAALDPRALIDLPLIHEESDDQWQNWFRANGVGSTPMLGGPKLWHANMAIEAAKRGQGVALANELIAAEGVATGALVEITTTDVRLASYVLATRSDQWRRPAVQQFRQWVQDALAGRAARGG